VQRPVCPRLPSPSPKSVAVSQSVVTMSPLPGLGSNFTSLISHGCRHGLHYAARQGGLSSLPGHVQNGPDGRMVSTSIML